MSQAFELLMEYRLTALNFERVMVRIEKLTDRLTALSAGSGQEKVMTSITVGDQMAETVCELQTLSLEMLDALNAAENARRHVGNIIYLVRGKHGGQWQQVLELRYIKRMSWRQIGSEMERDQRTVRRWHDNAVGVIDGLLHYTKEQ